MRKRIFIVLVVLVLLGAALVVGAFVLNGSRDPGQVATRYAELLATGDSASADAMVGPTREQRTANGDMPTGELLRSAVERPRVRSVVAEAGTSRATVEYELAGRTYRHTLVAERVDKLGVLEEWGLVEPMMVPVSVSSAAPSLGGVSIGGFAVESSRLVYLYPGAYELTATVPSRYLRPMNDLIAAGDRDADTPMETVEVDAGVAPTDELFAFLNAEVRAQTARCLARTRPSSCPLLPNDAVGFTLLAEPEVRDLALTAEPQSADTSTLTFATTEAGYRTTDGRGGTFTLAGKVDISRQDQAVITFEYVP